MAKKGKGGLPATQTKRETVKVQPAGIIEPDKKNDLTVPMPDVGYKIEEEAPSSLTPIVEFNGPGDWIAGEYVGTRDNIGPNSSRLYDLKVDGNYFCSIWGSTILDTKFNMLNPKPGQTIFIQYLGSVATGRGMNPAKNFKVAVVSKK